MRQELELEFETDDSLAGFRLDRVEVLNWGTFHRRVWTLHTGGRNALITGDIGSGKSTLVDAVTTLLVPANRITYNKAAGADTRERSLRSYVQGYYKLERSDSGYGARPVALRDQSNYSVILGVFCNHGFRQTVTLAQVFWHNAGGGQPNRFFVVADRDLSIETHFAGFGTDIRTLKKSFRQAQGVEKPFDTFPPYAAAFKRRFGIENDQALELFNQTVSMKSVGNLTAFVRSHMLDTRDVGPRVEALIAHFDDLTRAHDAVVRAKNQIARLTPLVKDLDSHEQVAREREHLRWGRDGLRVYCARVQKKLLENRLDRLAESCRRCSARIERHGRTRGELMTERDGLKQSIAENGGDRLEQLKSKIGSLEITRDRCGEKAGEYRGYAEALSMPVEHSLAVFLDNRRQVGEQLAACERHEVELQNRRTEEEVIMARDREQHSALCEELESLRRRTSNIDTAQILIRQKLCEALSLDEETLPFAGELLQVREEQSHWQGAAERLLRSFGLSLLVPERHYPRASAYVDATNLRGRLIYYKVPANPTRASRSPHPHSLVHKIAIRPDSECYEWLESELARRFDYACCDSLEQFRRERQAMTIKGQIKGRGGRHEKDDRHGLDDRSRYVLGWSNREKIEALDRRRTHLEHRIQRSARAIAEIQGQVTKLRSRKELLIRLDGFRNFDELDWQGPARQIADLHEELVALEAASNVLAELGARLKALEEKIGGTEERLDTEKADLARDRERTERARELLDGCESLLGTVDTTTLDHLCEYLEPLCGEVLGERRLTVESMDSSQQEVREWLQRKIDNEDKRLKYLEEKIIRTMEGYRRDFPAETSEVDAAVGAGQEYRAMLEALRADDLPKFEKRFKALLNENTIREIASFQSQLNRERHEIRQRIDTINRSLADIEYNPGRYILLEAQASADPEIRDFQQSLRACTEGALTGSDEEQYAERKFLQVKDIIDRFRGREGSADLDRRWTAKVTDVRNWFVFAASERWTEDDSEHEHYTDSGGKSGGQKEKLAYTVLAASLAYQFGLEWGAVRSRSFRFVIIDEAFGRGSDESARFGLELFKRLNLQLLIITPLQKIHIIEPYVAGVGFVHCSDGREAQLRNLTIEEYRAQKQARIA